MATEHAKSKSVNPTKAIQASIRNKMYYSGDPSDTSKMFICKRDLYDAWADHHLSTLFPASKYSDEDIRRIRREFLRILSTLILIGWSAEDLLTRFRSDFLRAGDRTDRDLPFNESVYSKRILTTAY